MRATTVRQHSPLRWVIKGAVIVLIIALLGAFSYLNEVRDPKLDVAYSRQVIFEELSNSTSSADGEDDCPGYGLIQFFL